MHEHRNIVFTGLLHHEVTNRGFGFDQSFVKVQFGIHIRADCIVVDRLKNGRHDEEGQEQSETYQHRVRRSLRSAQGLAQDRQHNDDAHKRGHHEQHRWQQREGRHQAQQLQTHAVLLAGFAATHIDEWNTLRLRHHRHHAHGNE